MKQRRFSPNICAISVGIILCGALMVYGINQTQDEFPLSIPTWDGEASIQLGPGFEQTELNKKYLILFKWGTRDSLYSYSSIDDSGGRKKKSVERVGIPYNDISDTLLYYDLTDWRFIEDDQGNRFKIFYGAFPSDNRFFVGCGLTPVWSAGDGEDLDAVYVMCECYGSADPIEKFPDIEAKSSPENTLSISWPPIVGADDYGVIIWSQQPTYDGFFEGIVFTAEFSADNLPNIIDTSLSTNHEYFIAVWARNMDVTAVEESLLCKIQPFYVMDLEHFEVEPPTAVQHRSWGQIKADIK